MKVEIVFIRHLRFQVPAKICSASPQIKKDTAKTELGIFPFPTGFAENFAFSNNCNGPGAETLLTLPSNLPGTSYMLGSPFFPPFT